MPQQQNPETFLVGLSNQERSIIKKTVLQDQLVPFQLKKNFFYRYFKQRLIADASIPILNHDNQLKVYKIIFLINVILIFKIKKCQIAFLAFQKDFSTYYLYVKIFYCRKTLDAAFKGSFINCHNIEHIYQNFYQKLYTLPKSCNISCLVQIYKNFFCFIY